MNAQSTTTESTQRFLTLTLGEELFALNISSVREILDMTEITRIPHAPEFMRGVVNVRGSAVPVIDLGLKFGLNKIETTIHTRIVIVEIRQGADMTTIGAIADSVREVLELEMDKINHAPRMGAVIRSDSLLGIGKHNGKFVLILDVAKIFSVDELLAMGEHEGPAAEAAEPHGEEIEVEHA